jgi:hypothetical protein
MARLRTGKVLEWQQHSHRIERDLQRRTYVTCSIPQSVRTAFHQSLSSADFTNAGSRNLTSNVQYAGNADANHIQLTFQCSPDSIPQSTYRDGQAVG